MEEKERAVQMNRRGGKTRRIVDDGAYNKAMGLLDEWNPSSDWREGLAQLRKAIGSGGEAGQAETPQVETGGVNAGAAPESMTPRSNMDRRDPPAAAQRQPTRVPFDLPDFSFVIFAFVQVSAMPMV